MKGKFTLRVLAFFMGLAGLAVLVATVYPIASYQAMSKEKYPILLNPLVERRGVKLEDYDYTKASNWFIGGVEKEDFQISKVAFYTLSIPRLKIENATVAIGGEDLAEHLIQYPGTALPGKRGNAVIFGHSVLPRFYNPKDYISIFSLLPTLKKGDDVKVYYDGVSYLYRVEDIFEVYPTDVQVLEQNSNDSYITLVTCTPPGDPRKPKRLIVRAKIVPPEANSG